MQWRQYRQRKSGFILMSALVLSLLMVALVAAALYFIFIFKLTF